MSDDVNAQWSAIEIDLIVADYFGMLTGELTGQPPIKARHNAALRDKIGRSKGSIEFKHCNISAVLDELGQPFIRGYLPRFNFQAALVLGVQRYLETQVPIEDIVLNPQSHLAQSGEIFMESQPSYTPTTDADRLPEMQRLISKFDPALRDDRNRRLGRYGEEKVLLSERGRLLRLGRDDLSRRVRWVSQEDGDGAGYDILTFDNTGRERFLEVKTTLGGKRTPFFMTRNEKEFSDDAGDRFRIFRLYDAAKSPRAFMLEPPLERSASLTPQVWKASFS